MMRYLTVSEEKIISRSVNIYCVKERILKLLKENLILVPFNVMKLKDLR